MIRPSVKRVSTRIFHPNWHTLVYFCRGNQILLGKKKRGLGVGRYNGFGGKPIERETPIATAIRETQEEVGLTPRTLIHVANLRFRSKTYAPLKDLYVYVFTSLRFKGESSETNEMVPRWFEQDEIPYDLMWPDDPHWLPQVLDGKFVTGEFWFDENEHMTNYGVETYVL